MRESQILFLLEQIENILIAWPFWLAKEKSQNKLTDKKKERKRNKNKGRVKWI